MRRSNEKAPSTGQGTSIVNTLVITYTLPLYLSQLPNLGRLSEADSWPVIRVECPCLFLNQSLHPLSASSERLPLRPPLVGAPLHGGMLVHGLSLLLVVALVGLVTCAEDYYNVRFCGRAVARGTLTRPSA